MPCGTCGGGRAARARTGRTLTTSGDLAPAPATVPEAQAKYVVITGDTVRGYASYADAARGQATHGGRLRTAK